MKVDFDSWETFITALETGSFLQSARLMQIDVSTVSRRLFRLEETLGLQLFYRESTGVDPTVAGQNLFSQVKPIIERMREIRTELSEAAAPLRGRYYVSLEPELALPSVFAFFSRLEATNSGLGFDFGIRSRSQQTRVPENLADTEGADLRIVFDGDLRKGFIEAGKMRVVTAASPRYLSAKGIPQTPEELPDHRLIFWGHPDEFRRLLFTKTAETDRLLDSRDSGETVSIPCRAASFHEKAAAAIEEASQNGGIAIGVPQSLLELQTSGSLHEILKGWHLPSLHVTVKPQRHLAGCHAGSYLVEAFARALDEMTAPVRIQHEELAPAQRKGE